MKKGKVVLVGTGFVGMSMAYSMLNRGGIQELILIDIDKNKTIGEKWIYLMVTICTTKNDYQSRRL